MIKDETMNIEYDLDYTTIKKSSWINEAQYLMLHHTWWGTFKSNMDYLAHSSTEVSTHYIIGSKWEIGRIWLDSYIMWHAWSWDKEYWAYINDKALWIEVASDWFTYTDIQIKALKKLILELQKKHNILKENIIRHKDYTTRKWDIWDNFYEWYNSFEEWKESLWESEELESLRKENKELRLRLVAIDKIVHWK